MARSRKDSCLGSTENNIHVGDYVMYRPGVTPGDFYGTVTKLEKHEGGDIIYVKLDIDGAEYSNYEWHFKVINPKNK